jgi:hypothetical protein
VPDIEPGRYTLFVASPFDSTIVDGIQLEAVAHLEYDFEWMVALLNVINAPRTAFISAIGATPDVRWVSRVYANRVGVAVFPEIPVGAVVLHKSPECIDNILDLPTLIELSISVEIQNVFTLPGDLRTEGDMHRPAPETVRTFRRLNQESLHIYCSDGGAPLAGIESFESVFLTAYPDDEYECSVIQMARAFNKLGVSIDDVRFGVWEDADGRVEVLFYESRDFGRRRIFH